MTATPSSILALDVGAKRVGVAIASLAALLPRPLITLPRQGDFWVLLQNIVEIEGVTTIIVGLPRGLSGQHTAQTRIIEAFAAELRTHFAMPVHFQDEALTSHRAQAELEARGRDYDRGDIDALAATYILEDFLANDKVVSA